MIMESVFSFLSSYFSIIFLVKGKPSQSVSLFLSHIEPKWSWPTTLQDLKSNISLEKSNEMVYFFTYWYQKLRVDRKILGWCSHKWLWPYWSQGKWMNKWWIELIFHADANWRKLRVIYFDNFWVAVVKNGYGTLFSMNG